MINLTQHPASPEQKEAGVEDLEYGLSRLRYFLTFEEIPSPKQVRWVADRIADLAARVGARSAMIGGAPFLMGPLEQALSNRGIAPFYAFSKRESVEVTLPDGGVKKTQVFRHLGFVPSASHVPTCDCEFLKDIGQY